MNIAIIGSGIAGLTCAWRLAGHHQVTLFEAGATPGGHTATVDVATPQGTWAIDTGFIVYNDRTYPRFMGLLSELGISGQKTQMSFSVHNPQSGLEYNGHTLTSLFAQRRNLLNPAFWTLLKEIVRFNRLAKQTLRGEVDGSATLETFLRQHRFTPFFARHYILPMGAAIWSSSIQEMKRFPLPLFLRFFENHGLLDITHRPQWYVVPGGSREYIRAMLDTLGDRLTLHLNDGKEEHYNLNGGRPRLAAEFEAFARAIEGGDQELCSRMLDTSIAVSRVLTAARRSAGIRFPCDP
mgnify:CR=1 FL=1